MDDSSRLEAMGVHGLARAGRVIAHIALVGVQMVVLSTAVRAADVKLYVGAGSSLAQVIAQTDWQTAVPNAGVQMNDINSVAFRRQHVVSVKDALAGDYDAILWYASRMHDSLTSFLPLDAYLAVDPFTTSGYNAFLDREREAGRLYELPLDVTPMVVYYDRDQLAADGLPEPKPGWTWKDFHDLAARLTSEGPGGRVYGMGELSLRIALSRQPVGFFPDLWLYMLLESGDPRTLDAQTLQSTLAFQKSMEPYWGPCRLDARRGSARCGMEVSFFGAGYVPVNATNVGVVPLPALDDHHPESFTQGDALAIFNTSKQPNRAWRVIRYLAGRDEAAKLAAQGLMPADVTPGAAGIWLDFWRSHAPSLHGLENVLAIQPVMTPPPLTTTWWGEMYAVETRFRSGKITLAEAVKEAVSVNQTVLAGSAAH